MNYEKLSDKEMLLLIRGGDAEARNQLILRYEPLIYKVTGGYFLPAGSRDELIQLGRLAVDSAIDTYIEGGISFRSYISYCIRCDCIDAIRSGNTISSSTIANYVSLSENTEREPDGLGYSEGPEEQLIRLDETKQRLRAVERLLTPQQFEFICDYASGATMRALMEKYGYTYKQVDNRIQQIRQKLKGLV